MYKIILHRRVIKFISSRSPKEKERVKERVPEYVYKTQQDFMECPQCKRVYWPGSHWQNIREALNKTGLNG